MSSAAIVGSAETGRDANDCFVHKNLCLPVRLPHERLQRLLSNDWREAVRLRGPGEPRSCLTHWM